MSSVYIHIPFCRSKCPYCDFYSLSGADESLIEAYVDALCSDIRRSLPSSARITSVFIGGGTPSLLGVEHLERIVCALHAVAELDGDAEFSVEVNPGSATPSWLKQVCAMGVNRVSIGVQSFQDQALRILGRRHTGADALACFEAARTAGFININIDMMFALPRTLSLHQLRLLQQADQEQVARLHPEHVSVYGLTLETDTPFGILHEQGEFAECSDSEFTRQFMRWHQCLNAHGYTHYEISNYARDTYTCRHNLAYWERKTCYAFGAAAHAFSVVGHGVRLACEADVNTYIRTVAAGNDPRREVERFDAPQAMAEWVYLRLRLHSGVDGAEFQRRFGCSFAQVYADAIRGCGPALQGVEGRWAFSPEAWLLYNHYVKNFLCPPGF